METHTAIFTTPPFRAAPQQPNPLTTDDEPEEWAYAWERLSTTTPDDKAEACPHCSEVWQYMGSILEQSTKSATILHEFRHRHHPRMLRRCYELIPASPAFQRRHGCK